MPEVTIYTTPTCSWCAAAKRFLDGHDVEYTEYDVSEDPEVLMRISDQTGVPVLDIDGEIVIGFDKERIAELLGLEDD